MAERYLTKPFVDVPKRQLSPIEQRLAGSYAKPENQWDLGSIVRELDPTYTIPRGIDTLSNVDYGALRDMLLGKYQISKNPRQDLERAGQAALGTVEGVADVSPLALGVKPAIKAAKTLAPEMATMAERYSLDPNAYIVPPEGNLNLTSRVTKEKLKGPDKQLVANFIQQARALPGVSKEGIEKMIRESSYLQDPTTVMTKEQFENSMPASKYNAVDLSNAAESDIDHYMVQAEEQITPYDALEAVGVPSQFTTDAMMLEYGDIEFHELDATSKRYLGRIYGIDESMSPEDIQNIVQDRNYEFYQDALYDRAHALQEMDAEGVTAHAYQRAQRLVDPNEEGYFEIGVQHPEYQGEYRHYPKAPQGTIGHIRGTLTERPIKTIAGVEIPENSYIVEELQSDVQKKTDQVGPLHQVHGVLLKAAVQDALERGASRVYVPTYHTIGQARYSPGGEYASIYDEAVKEALDPLSNISGVKITKAEQLPTSHRWTNDETRDALNILGVPRKLHNHIEGMLKGRVTGATAEESNSIMQFIESITPSDEAPLTSLLQKMDEIKLTRNKELQQVAELAEKDPSKYSYHIIEFSPEAKNQLLHGPGQTTPGYAKGGKVDKEEYSMPEKINRYIRNSQFKAADLVGLGPEVDFATTIPERYYPADEQHMGRGDAMRHLLLQAQLYKKYGELPAKTIGFLHEMLGGGQTDAEEAMDKYNDVLGREIGKASKDRYDMVKRAMEAIENEKARVMTEAEKRESGYAEGGLVYNDDLINQLAEDLFGVK